MAEKYLIGIDIGTQGTKAALFAEDGRCVAEAFQKSDLHQPSPGIVEEDPEAFVMDPGTEIIRDDRGVRIARMDEESD